MDPELKQWAIEWMKKTESDHDIVMLSRVITLAEKPDAQTPMPIPPTMWDPNMTQPWQAPIICGKGSTS